MTDRVMCSNCGAPVTRQGNESSVPCPHCQVANDFPVAASAKGSSRNRDDDDDDDDDDRRGGIPQIVIIQAPAAQAPRVVQSGPVYIQRQRSLASYLIVPIIFVVVASVVGSIIRARAIRLASEIPAAERAAERAAEKAPEKAPEHKSGKR